MIKKLLSEHSEISCMRLMALISLAVGSVLAFYSIYSGCGISEATPVIGLFIGGAFGGKATQKYIEMSKKDDTK